MKTTQLKSITARLNPFAYYSKTPRLLLSMLPPNAHKTIQIKTTQLPRSSALPAQLELAFKDGKVMKWEWSDVSPPTAQQAATQASQQQQQKQAALEDVVTEVQRHTRMLARKEELQS